MDNLKLMVAGATNEIYLGTMKKNSKYPVMNEKRRVFTNEVIRAAAEHMMSVKGNAYVWEGHGRLVWIPEEKKTN